MSSSVMLVEGLKRELKAHGITYAELARRIGMSEASVKRMFAQRSFTLQRLDEVLAAAGIDLLDLTRAALEAPRLIAQLSYAQEEELIGDPKLLLVAVAALNGVPVDELVATFALTEAEAVKHLLRLDKIGFLVLKPNNRVKLLVARTFDWIPNGPIQTWFRREAAADYLDARFDGEGEILRLVSVMLSPSSTAALLERLRQVADDFSQQHQADARLPYEARQSMTFLLAARPWMPEAFAALRRGEAVSGAVRPAPVAAPRHPASSNGRRSSR
ncbi:helix-turn-helix domain-containing protein [Pseudoduganella umbonata]|uniref:Helix-turn-helix transcriptional regulator n=1 Tax=Pseudoduganella umbonata TaxID=864828 RepID=A0A4P8HQ62_9BURK|nr:helix-turn-helix transcriptional regulator [Pseudoduganella umbonata]MBB3220608.1 transcriptional regulator with XRE-family HTH domain [Pseudoduganella umbonata]QCP11893.1 helix-turn-helix transcriptional regulator [Pseudoduganella umbonata]